MTRAAMALGLVFGVGALVSATSAEALNQDAENCHFEKQCHVVTPSCPGTGQYHKTHPCHAPYKVCQQVKVCVGD